LKLKYFLSYENTFSWHDFYDLGTEIALTITNMKKAHLRSLLIVVLVLFTVILTSASGQADVKASFLYYLANFTGTVPYSGGRVIADKERTRSM
jgi:hypothetical protein